MATTASSVDGARDAIERGEVVVVPTDTVYGLGVRADLVDGCECIFAMKGRPDTSALAVLVANLDQALSLADASEATKLRLLGDAFWPGALSIVVRRAPQVDFHLGGDETTIGLRVPAGALVRQLITEVGPLAVSSANRHGAPPCTTLDEVRAVFGPSVVALDGGRCAGAPSSVVSILEGTPKSLREGPVSYEEIVRALGG